MAWKTSIASSILKKKRNNNINLLSMSLSRVGKALLFVGLPSKRVCRHASNLSNSPCLPTRTVFYSTKFYGGRYDSNNTNSIPHHPEHGCVAIYPEEGAPLL